MKQPEHMDSTDLCPDSPTDDDVRQSVTAWLDEQTDFDAAEFFEAYVDPEGPFRYSGTLDAWDAIWGLVASDPHMMAECLREWIRDNP